MKSRLQHDSTAVHSSLTLAQRRQRYISFLQKSKDHPNVNIPLLNEYAAQAEYSSDPNSPLYVALPTTPPDMRFRKKGHKQKVAMIMSYCGTGYQGLQVNPGTRTIESEIVKALGVNGFINEFQLEKVSTTGLGRSARTDKGVHAAANIVTVKLRVLPEHLCPQVARVNARIAPLADAARTEILAAVRADLAAAGVMVSEELVQCEAFVFPWGGLYLAPSLAEFIAAHPGSVAEVEARHRAAIAAELSALELQQLQGRYLNKRPEFTQIDWTHLKNTPDAAARDEHIAEVLAKRVVEEEAANVKTEYSDRNSPREEDDEADADSSVDAYAREIMADSRYLSECASSLLNAALPEQIRVSGMVRVSKGFNPKNEASSRTYEYIVPTFAFLPIADYPEGVYERMLEQVPRMPSLSELEHQRVMRTMELNADGGADKAEDDDPKSGGRDRGRSKAPQPDAEPVAEVASETKAERVARLSVELDDVPAALRDYRITEEGRARVDEILKVFEGTNNHHNFTKGRAPTDKSCYRFIRSFATNGLFYLNGVEFVHIEVHGQSFMLHQIRKMIGYAIGVARGTLTVDDAKKFFSKDRYRVPIAPALGLLLGQVHFRGYDMKAAANIETARGAAIITSRDPISSELEYMMPNILGFKQSRIYPEICNRELQCQSCWSWLHWVNDMNYWGQPQSDAHDKGKRIRIESKENIQDLGSLDYVKLGEKVEQENK